MFEKKYTDSLKNPAKLAGIVLCLAFIILPICIVLSRYGGIYFLLFSIFYAILPGGLVVRLITPTTNSKGVLFLLSFLCGTALLFFEYFFLYAIGHMDFIRYINPTLAIIFIALSFKNTKTNINKIAHTLNQNVEFLPFLAIVVTFTAIYLNYYMPHPEAIQYPDYTWQIGNINQLSSDTPFDDIRVTGVTFAYHFFNTLFLAIAKIVTRQDGWLYAVQYQVLLMPFLCATAIYCLIKKAIRDRWLVFIISVATFFGFSFSYAFSDLSFQIASNVNAVGMASIIIITLFLILTHSPDETERFKKKFWANILYSLMLIILLTGVKGPYGIVFLVAYIIYFILDFIKYKKIRMFSLVFLVGALPIFILMYIVLFTNGTGGYFNESIFETLLLSSVRTPYFNELFNNLGGNSIHKILLFIPSLILTFTIAFVPLVVAIVRLIMHVFTKREIDGDKLLATLIFLVGTAAYYTFYIEGSSHVYFILSALPFVGYITAYEISEFVSFKKHFRNIVIVTLCFICVVNINNSLIPSLSNISAQNLIDYVVGNKKTYPDQKLQEHESYTFLKQYITDDRLILTNRLSPTGVEDEVFHELSAFSEHKCYFEGFMYAERNLGYTDAHTRIVELVNLFGEEWTQQEKYDFQQSKNIGYVVVFLHDKDEIVHPQAGEYYHEIFRNDSVVIYELI